MCARVMSRQAPVLHTWLVLRTLVILMPSLMPAVADVPVQDNASTVFMPDEARLVHDLLEVYRQVGIIARPALNSSRLMKVAFGMRLIQMDIIEKEQVLKTSVWVRARWVDEYLRWDPAEYGGLQQIVLPWQQVWTPDIVLVNTAETDQDERPADIMVSYMGGVVWSPHRMFKSACLVDVTNFPYDKHSCDMWFQSMSRFSWQMDLIPYGRSPWDLETYLASFKESQEWEILLNETERVPRSRDVGVLLKFSRRVALRFTLTVRRRLGYTGHLLMLPCVFLGCMTLVVFCLPPERPDRHTLATSLFGSFMVLILILVEVAPPTASSVPKLGMYYACNMTLVMISIFLSGMVINISRRGERKQTVPKIVKVLIVDGLSRILLLHSRIYRMFEWRVTQVPDDSELGVIDELYSDTDSLQRVFSDAPNNNSNLMAMADMSTASRKLSETTQDSKESYDINMRLHHMETLIQSFKPQRETVSKNWKILKLQWTAIALVLDRFFFFIYLITLIITLCLLFPRRTF